MVFVRDNNVDQALKMLKKKMQRESSAVSFIGSVLV
jgi:ribosomal protein S21